MSEEQVKASLAKAQHDMSLQAKLKEAKSPDDVVALAKERGHEFSSEHVMQLNEEDLEGISGGVNLCASMFCGWPILLMTNVLTQKSPQLAINYFPGMI